MVGADKSSCLTYGVKSVKETMFFLNQDGDEEVSKPAKKAPTAKTGTNGNPSPTKHKTAGGKVLRNKTRSAAHEDLVQSASAKISDHQREIHQRLMAEGLARFSEGGGGLAGKEGKTWKRFQSYKGEVGLPKEVENLRVSFLLLNCYRGANHWWQIFVDRKAHTIILPIHGFAVPFHINTIKNASKNDEGEFTFLRINFQTPGQLAGKKEDTVSCWITNLSVLSQCGVYSLSKIPMRHSSVRSRIDHPTVTVSMPSANKSPN